MSVAAVMPPQPEHPNAFVWDLAAVFMILLAYFTKLVLAEGHDFAQPTFLVMAGALLISAVICVVLISLRPESLRPALLVVLTSAVFYMESGFPLPGGFAQWVIELTSPAMLLVIRLVVYVLPIAIFYWLIPEKLSIILTLVFGAISAIGLVIH